MAFGTTIPALLSPRAMITATIGAFLLTAVLAVTTALSDRTLRTFARQDLALLDALGSIIHLDEVLTMSARMAAVTGDHRWVDRYRRAEPQLDVHIATALVLAPDDPETAFLRQTDDANRRLVALENECLRLVEAGDRVAAMERVFGAEYEQLKAAYIEGAMESQAACKARITRNLLLQRRAIIINGGLATLAAIAGFSMLVVTIRTASRRQQLRHDMQAAMRGSTLGQLAGSLAHELNQPLAAVVNYCAAARELAHDPAQAPRVAEAIERAEQQAVRAGRIIQRIRAFVRRESSEHTQIDLAELIRDASRLVQLDTRAANVTLRINARPGVIVTGDAVQLQQVVVNLLLNAIDACRAASGGGHIGIDLFEHDGQPVLEVSDNGLGVPRSLEKTLFEAFQSSKPDGLGLGLNISRGIVEEHRGRITHERRGDTTVFQVRLERGSIPS